jgi:tRNA wybutosine-synthesizing protein 3
MQSKAGTERFSMVKEYHRTTFEKAVREKKADPLVIPLCRFLNQQLEFFTASSCSGRITVLELDESENKRESAFFYKKHGSVQTEAVWKRIREKSRNNLWFKQEPFILHLGTNHLENARLLLECCKEAGIKRAGIMVAKPGKFVLEIIGTQGLAVPVKQKNRMLVEKKFFRFLVKQANKKLERNFERLKKFEQALRKKLPLEKKETKEREKT